MTSVPLQYLWPTAEQKPAEQKPAIVPGLTHDRIKRVTTGMTSMPLRHLNCTF